MGKARMGRQILVFGRGLHTADPLDATSTAANRFCIQTATQRKSTVILQLLCRRNHPANPHGCSVSVMDSVTPHRMQQYQQLTRHRVCIASAPFLQTLGLHTHSAGDFLQSSSLVSQLSISLVQRAKLSGTLSGNGWAGIGSSNSAGICGA